MPDQLDVPIITETSWGRIERTHRGGVITVAHVVTEYLAEDGSLLVGVVVWPKEHLVRISTYSVEGQPKCEALLAALPEAMALASREKVALGPPPKTEVFR